MHMDHEAGEILEADFTGKKLSYVDKTTSEVVDGDALITVFPPLSIVLPFFHGNPPIFS